MSEESLIRKIPHNAHGLTYELDIYKVGKTGGHKVYVIRDGIRRGSIYCATEDLIADGHIIDESIIDGLVNVIKEVINREQL